MRAWTQRTTNWSYEPETIDEYIHWRYTPFKLGLAYLARGDGLEFVFLLMDPQLCAIGRLKTTLAAHVVHHGVLLLYVPLQVLLRDGTVVALVTRVRLVTCTHNTSRHMAGTVRHPSVHLNTSSD